MANPQDLTPEQIAAIDWGLPRQQIADALGITRFQLNEIRKSQGVPQTKFSPKPAKTDWSKVDYTRRTRDIMEEFKVSRAWVCRMRRKYTGENQ